MAKSMRACISSCSNVFGEHGCLCVCVCVCVCVLSVFVLLWHHHIYVHYVRTHVRICVHENKHRITLVSTTRVEALIYVSTYLHIHTNRWKHPYIHVRKPASSEN